MYISSLSLHRLACRIPRPIAVIARGVELLNLVTFGAVVPRTSVIGPGTTFDHRGLGIVIHPEAVIGRDCKIFHQVTVGGRADIEGAPQLGDGVLVGTGAKILGPIKIGDGAKIGAGAIVVHDVPSGATVIGPAARALTGT